MTLMGSYRVSGMYGKSGASNSIINFTGYKPSGLNSGNLLGIAMFCWSGPSTTKGGWIPVRNDFLK